MKKIKILPLKLIMVMIIMLVSANSAVAQKKKEVRPKKFVNLVYMTGNSDFVYYALSEKSKTSVEITGPGNLTVYNRVRLENNESASSPYFIKYVIDGKRIATKKVGPQKRSTKIKYKNKLPGTPSKAEKEIIKIPPGKHIITFYKYKTKQKAHVRFIYQPSEKLEWTELSASNKLDEVKIQYTKSEKQQSYYRIDHKKGFAFTAQNHSNIKLFLRADFNYKMHAENIIRFVLKKDGKPIKTYKVTCKKSSTVQNITDKALMPGILEKIFIDIPNEEKHLYEIVLKDPGKSAIIRVFMGKKKTSEIKTSS